MNWDKFKIPTPKPGEEAMAPKWLISLIHAEETAAEEARTDEVTGLPNRRAWNERLSEHVRSRHPLAILILDIDKFKAINDTYGHDGGDLILRQVAQIIHSRADDFAARIGGDEFGIILDTSGCHTSEEVEKEVAALTERINKQIGEYNQHAKVQFHLSIGSDISMKPPHDIGRTTRRSDQSMYATKKTK